MFSLTKSDAVKVVPMASSVDEVLIDEVDRVVEGDSSITG